MLKISGAGWAEVTIEGKMIIEGSYLTDVPCDFMKALYDFFSYNDTDNKLISRSSASVYVDAEGGVANFVFSDMFYSGNGQKVFVFYPANTKTGWEIEAFNVDPYDLAIELIHDIESEFENWVTWGSDDSPEGLTTARNNLTFWLGKLKSVVKNEKPYEEKVKAWNTPGTPENDEIERVKRLALENIEKNKDAIPLDHIEKYIPKDDE